jgi:hydroxymethylbilane synthase
VTRVPPQAAVIAIGTRKSALARRQTARVAELLSEAWPDLSCEVKPIVTRGDRTQQTGEPLPEIGGKGLFTAELEESLRAGELDLAVHSLKDLPTEDPPDLTVGAVCRRDDARDCLISRNGDRLEDLPPGAIVGTSSLRRAAQLRALRPELEVRSIRGNVDTRIRKVRDGEFDATVLAAAGVLRLGLEDEVAQWLSLEAMLPAPGQGALAVQCRTDDEHVRELLAAIDDPPTRAATTAERTFLRELGAGCTAPVGAHATPLDAKHVELVGLVISPDGRRFIRQQGRGKPEEVGAQLAQAALEGGADRIIVERDARAGPLAGKRIVVTRPRPQSEELATRLEDLGAAVAIVPLVEIQEVEDVALDVAAREVVNYDWVVFTSANAVAALRARGADLASTRLAAVGRTTAEALRSIGVEPEVVPAVFAAEELPAALGPIERLHLLLAQADGADPALADELRRRGANVNTVVAYRTVARNLSALGIVTLRRADAIVLASGSAVRSLATSAPHLTGESAALLGTRYVFIGPKTAAVAREVGLPEGIVADEATSEGIIHALVSYFEKRADS